jgi:hypothetical protein
MIGLHVRNLVACNAISRTEPFTLNRVRVRWPRPPRQFAIWVEVINPAERDFTVRVQVYRGQHLIHETAEELVLEGCDRMEFAYRFASKRLESKSYKLAVLLNGVPSRTMFVDFGAKDVTGEDQDAI